MMKLLKNNRKDYRKANTWFAFFRIREEKKQAVQDMQLSQQTFVTPQAVSLTPQVIFTRADVGHNQEETQKIKELYTELDGLPLLPFYAFV